MSTKQWWGLLLGIVLLVGGSLYAMIVYDQHSFAAQRSNFGRDLRAIGFQLAAMPGENPRKVQGSDSRLVVAVVLVDGCGFQLEQPWGEHDTLTVNDVSVIAYELTATVRAGTWEVADVIGLSSPSPSPQRLAEYAGGHPDIMKRCRA
jgi:hypothetical protein